MRNTLRRSRSASGKHNHSKSNTRQKSNKKYYKKGKDFNPLRQQMESNGPLGKIRGNAQQIYDKYKTAWQDTVSSDVGKAELLCQYAEHYLIMIGDYKELYPDTVKMDEKYTDEGANDDMDTPSSVDTDTSPSDDEV